MDEVDAVDESNELSAETELIGMPLPLPDGRLPCVCPLEIQGAQHYRHPGLKSTGAEGKILAAPGLAPPRLD
jgi:hypothetical protein